MKKKFKGNPITLLVQSWLLTDSQVSFFWLLSHSCVLVGFEPTKTYLLKMQQAIFFNIDNSSYPQTSNRMNEVWTAYVSYSTLLGRYSLVKHSWYKQTFTYSSLAFALSVGLFKVFRTTLRVFLLNQTLLKSFVEKKWRSRWVSNSRPLAWQASVLTNWTTTAF